MSSTRADGWSNPLHRLWAAAMTVPDRLELESEVLSALLVLPGAVAAAVVGQDAKGRTEQVRWAPGPDRRLVRGPLAADLERLVSRRREPVLITPAADLAALGHLDAAVSAAGGRTLFVAGFALSSGAVVNLCVVFGDPADPESRAEQLAQITDIGRRAFERLAGQARDEDAQSRDALLAEASLQMDAVLDMAQTVHRVARMAVPAVADGCLVYLATGTRISPAVGVHVDARRRLPDDVPQRQLGWLGALVARTIADPAGATGVARELSPAAAEALGAKSLEITVLRARGRLLGAVVFLFDRADDRQPDPQFLQDLTRRAGLAIDNAELYEQRRRDVVTMQQHLLPAALRVVPGLTTSATYAVADEVLEVGGDFYDVVPRAGGGCAAVIGDVCGRGVEAAALTGTARHTLSTLLDEGMSGERALDRLNTVLRRDGSWRFVTCVIATFRPDPGGGFTVRIASAGHPPPLVLRASGKVVSARGGGVVLGVREPARISRSRLRLNPGDTLLMFTDGLTEARDADGVMFEDAGLHRSLTGQQDVAVGVLVDGLCRLAAGFRRTGTDDIAVLGLRADARTDGVEKQ